jgi:catechol-2,3-dioxygenase
MAKISKVGHVVLNVKDTKEAIDWYTDALGMELMVHDEGMDMAFLSFGTLDHDIALIKAPEGVETGSPGLSHTALALEGGEPELQEIYARVKDAGYAIDFTADHGLTKSFYCFDPSGNRIEIFFQNLHGEDARTFMRETGAVLDPYELEPASAD